jgi:hypothetical protein
MRHDFSSLVLELVQLQAALGKLRRIILHVFFLSPMIGPVCLGHALGEGLV